MGCGLARPDPTPSPDRRLVYPQILSPCSEEQLDPQAVPRALEEMLRRVVEAYTTAGVELPQRRLWSVGAVTEECSQLAVMLADLQPEPSELSPTCDTVMRATITVSVTRCVPVASNRNGDRPPTPQQLKDSGTLLGTDAYLLSKIACQLDLYGMGGLGTEVTVEDPTGGMQTITLQITPIL